MTNASKQTKQGAVVNNNRHEEVGFFATTKNMAPDRCTCEVPASQRNPGPVCIWCGCRQTF